jgi:transposase-like protein
VNRTRMTSLEGRGPEKWDKPYPAIQRLWENAWTEYVPFLDYDVEIRTIICSTNAIESLNARYSRGPRPRPLPQRASRNEMPPPHHQVPRPDQ